MIRGRIQLHFVYVLVTLLITCGWIFEIQGRSQPPSAVIDRMVDRQWVVFLVGSDEQEWILPVSSLQNVGAMLEHEVEGLWGHLEIIECNRQPCDPPLFAADYAKTREIYDRMEAKIAVLRARGPASLTFDRADAAVPSSRGCVERLLR